MLLRVSGISALEMPLRGKKNKLVPNICTGSKCGAISGEGHVNITQTYKPHFFIRLLPTESVIIICECQGRPVEAL